MPHLSPLKWLMALLLFSFVLISSTSLMWWTSTPMFILPKMTKSTPMFKWPW